MADGLRHTIRVILEFKVAGDDDLGILVVLHAGKNESVKYWIMLEGGNEPFLNVVSAKR